MALFMVKTWMGNKVTPIYGAEWAGTSDPSWVRTDAAVGFSDPNPYYAGMSSSPSSPFDNIMPWSGMRRVTDASAGELVEIPKFYYKWTLDGAKMKLQISMSAFDGSHVSPAHADRGDGVGERDYVYIGRYHSASDYKSKAGVSSVYYVSRVNWRSRIHSLGSYIYQNDYAMRWTICMLYLVEFANWNTQSKIGYGSSNENTGATDSMPYHTGTNKSSRGVQSSVQYRHIEGLWSQGMDWIDGIYFTSSGTYIIKNPNNFSDSSGGTYAIKRPTNSGWIGSYEKSNVTGLEYVLCPNSFRSSGETQYICDYSVNNSTGNSLISGGGPNASTWDGLFFFGSDISGSNGFVNVTSRLMVLPPSRLGV